MTNWNRNQEEIIKLYFDERRTPEEICRIVNTQQQCVSKALHPGNRLKARTKSAESAD